MFPVLLTGQTNTDFWFAAPEVTAGHGDQPIYIRLTSFNQTANVTISEPANTTTNFPVINVNIPANSTNTVDLTTRKEQVECKPANTVRNFGLHIHSDVPITAYYEEAHTNNPEIFTFKGNNALGTSFFIPSQDNLFNHSPLSPPAYNSFDIVATEDVTTVTITPKKNIVGHAAGVPFTIILNKGQVYSAQATGQQGVDHVMGSTVTSDKPVAITMKDDSDEYPGTGNYDLTGDQIVPVNIIGTEYIVVRGFTNSTVNDWVYITATVDNTNIYLNGSSTPAATIMSGATYHYSLTSTVLSSFIQTDQPAYVLHLTGYGGEVGSALLPPMDCTGSSQIAFTRSSQYSFELVILTKAGAQGWFVLDGNPNLVTATMFSPVAGNPAFVYARISFTTATLPVGAHILTNSQDIFHMGVIHTYDPSQLGCSYGYFTDFASLNLGPDQSVCPGTMVTFNAGPNRQSYAWFYNGNPYGSGGQTIQVTNPGLYSVTVNDHGCILSDEVQLTNLVAPSPVISGATEFCEGGSTVLSVTGTYLSYLWTTGATTPSITVNATGMYSVTVTNYNDCTGSASTNVTAHPLPVVSLAQPASVCTSTPPFALTGGSPGGTGGVYSGAGVNSVTGVFSPSAAGPGGHLITYMYTDAFGCSASASKTLMVNPLPNVQLASQGGVCISAPPYPLTGGTPAGGTYSGLGVNSSGIFDPSSGAGTHMIGYAYTDANGCSNSAYKVLTVYALPVVSLSAQSAVCISVPSFALSGGAPAGGVYSGTGVNSGTGIFSPSVAGPGGHTITFTYTDANGCTNTDSKVLTVYALPLVQLAAQGGACISDPPYALSGGSPLGGVYSGWGVVAGMFDPSSGIGAHTITYTYTNSNGCTSYDSKVLDVYTLPVVELAAQPSVCVSAQPFALSGGTPAGPAGTYSGPGVNSTTGMFDPSSGTGPHTITYTYSTSNGCTSSDSKVLIVNTLPTVQLSNQSAVCISVTPFLLTGGSPSGGTYSGVGVNSGIFDPSSGAGPHTITYLYTDANGCSSSDYKTLIVNPLPVVTLADQAAVCISATPYALSGGTPGGGGYSGTGVNSGIFDPSSGVGPHSITYTYSDGNGCTDAAVKTLMVNPLPVILFPLQTAVCITAPPFMLAGVTPVGGSFTGNGVSTAGIFDPSSGAGLHALTYTYTDANTCTNSAASSITVIALPLPSGSVTGPNPLCQATKNSTYLLSGSDPLATSFSWDLNPPAAGTISGAGTSPVISLNTGYTGTAGIRFMPISNCGSGNYSGYTGITVNPNPDVSLQSCNDAITTKGAKPFQLKGGLPIGGVYAVDGVPLPSGILDPANLSASPPDHIISYTYTNFFNCFVTSALSLKVDNASGFTCKNVLTDVRDCQSYPTFEVALGALKRCWMASNLNYGAYIQDHLVQADNCVAEKYCQDNDPLACSGSGAFYQWDELMNFLPADNASAEGRQGLCMPEWHVATEAEWAELETYYMGVGMAGWGMLDPNPMYGFHARTLGVLYQNLIWAFIPPDFSASLFWTSTVSPSDKTRVFSHGLNDINASVSKYFSARGNALQVRCVKD